MGEFANPFWLKVLAYTVAIFIAVAQRVAAGADLRRNGSADVQAHSGSAREHGLPTRASWSTCEGWRSLCGASLVLIHVADGWAARNIKQLDLRESEEMRRDREYLEELAAGSSRWASTPRRCSAAGDPAEEIMAAAEREQCDLIAMATHGHRLIGDLIHGSVANAVRHSTSIPVLLVRAPSGTPAR